MGAFGASAVCLGPVKLNFISDSNHLNDKGSEFYSKIVASKVSNEFEKNLDFEKTD